MATDVHTIVLMYHGVTEAGGGAANPHCISRRSFANQITYLARSACKVLPWNVIAAGAAPDGTAAVRVGLTFDDANASDLECTELLQRIGFTALFFVPTDEIGKSGRLARPDLVELCRQGMGIGSHSHHHVQLVQLGDRELDQELRRSKEILEDLTALPVEHLAFPGGAYDARVLVAGRRAGYRYFHTSDWGANSRKELTRGVLRRIPVVAGLGDADFRSMLEKRSFRSEQIRFRVKEIAKRMLGEQRYLQARRAVLKRISDR